MKLKSVFRRMLSMCPPAWQVFIRSLQLSVFLLLCAFMLMLECGGRLGHDYILYSTANSLNELSQAVLLVAVVLSVCIEDIQSGRP